MLLPDEYGEFDDWLSIGCGFSTTEFMYDYECGVFGKAMWLHDKYCECHQGYELGCAAKIPYPIESPAIASLSLFGGLEPHDVPGDDVHPGDNPKKWQEYCKFAAVWNGDIKYDKYDAIGLSSEVKECGCFFVGNARTKVGGCPGVDLYAHFPYDEE